MRYYNLKRYWHKVEPHVSDPEVQRILQRDFNKFTIGSWGEVFEKGTVPRNYETCLWDWWHEGPEPKFWQYTKHAACHWIVNFTLELAKRVLPKKEWRIITSEAHSTVWDGKDMLFDFNFQAFRLSPSYTFRAAMKNGRVLPVGKRVRVYWAMSTKQENRSYSPER